MVAAAALRPEYAAAHEERDQRVFLRGLSWSQFESFMRLKGDAPVPRITFLDGVLEMMSPSRAHESVKSALGRMVEAYCFEHDIRFTAVGSWTLKSRPRRRAVEPDECYIIGEDKNRPDLAIEVIHTSGGLDKLEVYAALGVAEVWLFEGGKLDVHRLKGGRYHPVQRSVCLPGLDLGALVRCAAEPTTYDAVRRFRRGLRAGQKRR
ncbi:MAG: Uma2 family endonuclease [Deltaproteobacteria bacterium]|nr:Uma2 family endonuclease [Deltaproteobacteria bacterium]